jgi:hypothetical protein
VETVARLGMLPSMGFLFSKSKNLLALSGGFTSSNVLDLSLRNPSVDQIDRYLMPISPIRKTRSPDHYDRNFQKKSQFHLKMKCSHLMILLP